MGSPGCFGASGIPGLRFPNATRGLGSIGAFQLRKAPGMQGSGLFPK